MKSFIRFIKTKSFFFFLTIERNQKINQKPLGFTKNLQKDS